MNTVFVKDIQYYKFCLYGFFKNLRFFEPFLILFFLEKDISFLQVGIIYSIREILINILEIPSGILADAFGRKKTLISSFVFYIISFLIFYFTQTFFSFIIAIIFYAIGDAFRTGNHKAMIFEYLSIQGWKDQRTHYYGHTRSWSQFGSAISSLVAASIVFYSGNYNTIFLMSVIPYIIDVLIVSTYPKQLDLVKGELSSKKIKDRFVSIFSDIAHSFRKISILKAIANLSVHSGFHRSIKDYLQPIIQTFALSLPFFLYFSDNQRSAILIGIIYSGIYLLTSFITRRAGKLKDQLKSMENSLNLTMYLGFIFALLCGIFFHYGFFLASIILYVLIFLLENLRNPIGVAYVSDLYKDDVLATALSLNSQSKSLIAAIIAPLLGFIADRFGVGVSLSVIAGLIVILSPLFIVKSEND